MFWNVEFWLKICAVLAMLVYSGRSSVQGRRRAVGRNSRGVEDEEKKTKTEKEGEKREKPKNKKNRKKGKMG
ncbi:hypothetical protein BT93_A1821 [Corymbia citriodora subsp. variegata]|nr:hypothetical protein BT93_A1821 [Corymbia citriodora subsp. variegata]